jgi:predicted lactoylglutathione lyase
MAKKIFINLPVTDLGRSTAFYSKLGAEQNAAFSNEQAAMMVLSDAIHLMLLTHDFYRTFTAKEIADAHRTSQVLLCLSEESRESVDSHVQRAEAAGGRADPSPKQEMGSFMYGRSFEDPDGHHWEVMWMDPAAMQAAHAPQPEEV